MLSFSLAKYLFTVLFVPPRTIIPTSTNTIMKNIDVNQLPSLKGTVGVGSANADHDTVMPPEPSTTTSSTTSSSSTSSRSFRATLGLVDENTHAVDEGAPSTTTKTEKILPPFAAIVGHRGALYAELENTVPAFVQCASWGCAGVELDVFTLKDGNVVVFHGAGNDEDPGYLTDYILDDDDNQDGPQRRSNNVLDLTYEETQKLRFNPAFHEFPCPADKITSGRIPLLSEVLEALRGTGLEIKIELKGPNTVGPVLELVESLHMTNQCSYSCFDHAKLQELRRLRPDKTAYRTGALFNTPVPADYLMRAQDCGATEVHLRYDTCTVERVQAIRQAGFKSMAWLRGPVGMASDINTMMYEDVGNEDGALYQALWETGVDQICGNRPDVALALRPKTATVEEQ